MISLNTDTIKVKENSQWQSLASLTGPKGDKGDTGATGSQGPQGIPGVPGYPTIQTGDAGKVLMVNSTEDAVEWDTFISGLDYIYNGNNLSGFHPSQDVLDNLVIGTSAIRSGDEVYVYYDKQVWDPSIYDITYNFYQTKLPSSYSDPMYNNWVWIGGKAEYNPHWNSDQGEWSVGGQFSFQKFSEQAFDTWSQSASQGDTATFQFKADVHQEDGYYQVDKYYFEEETGGGGGGYSIITLEGNSGTLTSAQLQAVLDGNCAILHRQSSAFARWNVFQYNGWFPAGNNISYAKIGPEFSPSTNVCSIYLISINTGSGAWSYGNTPKNYLPATSGNAGKALVVNSAGSGYELGDAVPIAPPTTAGTYTLQVVVDAQGVPTYSWV